LCCQIKRLSIAKTLNYYLLQTLFQMNSFRRKQAWDKRQEANEVA